MHVVYICLQYVWFQNVCPGAYLYVSISCCIHLLEILHACLCFKRPHSVQCPAQATFMRRRTRLIRSAALKLKCGRWRLRFEHAICDILNLKANIAWLMQQVMEDEDLDSWLACIQLRMELDELEQHFRILLHIWSLKHRIASIKFAHHIAKFWQSLGENKKARTRAKAKTRARAEARARDSIDGETITYTAAIIAWRKRLARAAQRGTGSMERPSRTPQQS